MRKVSASVLLQLIGPLCAKQWRFFSDSRISENIKSVWNRFTHSRGQSVVVSNDKNSAAYSVSIEFAIVIVPLKYMSLDQIVS